MPNFILALLIAALMGAAAPAAEAGSAPSQLRAGFGASPPKECPRLNGRIGYYANPWCSASEQRAWDVWEARAIKRAAGK